MTWSHSCQNLVVKTGWQKLSIFSRFIFLFKLVHMCLQGENQQCFISYQHFKWNRLWKFQIRQIVLCQKFLTHWLKPVLSAEKNGIIFWIWKQIWKISRKIIFWYNCDCTFSLAKYVSCQLSSGMHSSLTETSNKQTKKQTKLLMTLYWTLQVVSSQGQISFTSQPCPIHATLWQHLHLWVTIFKIKGHEGEN